MNDFNRRARSYRARDVQRAVLDDESNFVRVRRQRFVARDCLTNCAASSRSVFAIDWSCGRGDAISRCALSSSAFGRPSAGAAMLAKPNNIHLALQLAIEFVPRIVAETCP